MCIAIYKPAGKEIDYDTFKQCYESNPHGCGIIFINGDGKLETQKTMEFDAWWEMYKECLQESPDSPFVIHFRYATQGNIDEENCHPFWIDDHHAFVHNGTVRPVPNDPNKEKSDTVMFNEHILKGLPVDWFENDAIKALIEEFIGFSKLIVMNDFGEVEIYNESKGEWVDGVWFSNDYYKRKRTTTQNKYWGAYKDHGSTYMVDGFRYRWNYKKGLEERLVVGRGWVDENDSDFEVEPKWKKDKDKEEKKSGELITVYRCDWCGRLHPEDDLKVFRDNQADASSVFLHLILCDICTEDVGPRDEEGYSELKDADIGRYAMDFERNVQ